MHSRTFFLLIRAYRPFSSHFLMVDHYYFLFSSKFYIIDLIFFFISLLIPPSIKVTFLLGYFCPQRNVVQTNGEQNASFIKTLGSPAFSRWTFCNHSFNTNSFLRPFARLESSVPNFSLAVRALDDGHPFERLAISHSKSFLNCLLSLVRWLVTWIINSFACPLIACEN